MSKYSGILANLKSEKERKKSKLFSEFRWSLNPSSVLIILLNAKNGNYFCLFIADNSFFLVSQQNLLSDEKKRQQ